MSEIRLVRQVEGHARASKWTAGDRSGSSLASRAEHGRLLGSLVASILIHQGTEVTNASALSHPQERVLAREWTSGSTGELDVEKTSSFRTTSNTDRHTLPPSLFSTCLLVDDQPCPRCCLPSSLPLPLLLLVGMQRWPTGTRPPPLPHPTRSRSSSSRTSPKVSQTSARARDERLAIESFADSCCLLLRSAACRCAEGAPRGDLWPVRRDHRHRPPLVQKE